MNENNNTELSALTLAYQVVSGLGYNHAWLVNYNPLLVNYNTLRRIKEGRPGKKETDRFYLQLFVSLIRDEYQKRIKNGGEGATAILKQLSNILLRELGMDVL